VSRLTAALAAGRFVLTTSLGTLPDPDRDDLRRKLSEVRERFDCVKFAENPRPRARVSPWAAASVAITEGVEPIVHVTCPVTSRIRHKRESGACTLAATHRTAAEVSGEVHRATGSTNQRPGHGRE
jgi:hypothetical protein